MTGAAHSKSFIFFTSIILVTCLVLFGCFEETEIITAYDGNGLSREFGFSVDIDMVNTQTYALIGAPSDSTRAQNAGAVYVYRKASNNYSWEPLQKLYAADAAAGDRFGGAVSISGDIAVIGARYDDNSKGRDAGAAYVFRLVNGQFYQLQKLIRSKGRAYDHFGAAVSVSSWYAFIGSPYTWTVNGNQGEVDIYSKGYPVPKLSFVKTVQRSSAHTGGVFGEQISLDGIYAVVGAPDEHTNQISCGAVHIYSIQGGWHEVKRISDPDHNQYSDFGFSVSIEGNQVIVGSPGSELSLGAAYIYEPDQAGSPWAKLTKLTLPETYNFWFSFGKTVAIDDGVAIVGADGSYKEAPAAYVYAYVQSDNQGEWVFTKKLETAHEFQSGGIDVSRFADAMAISGDHAVIADPYTRWNECQLPKYCYQQDSLVYMYEKEQP
jgi:hypothetical protein